MLTRVRTQKQPRFTSGLLTSVTMKGRTTLAGRLKEIGGKDLRPVDLAKICKVSRVAAGKWLRGGDIKPLHLFRISDHYGVEARWLALGEEPKHRPKRLSGDAAELAALYDRLTPAVQDNIRDLIHTLTVPNVA